MRTDENGYLVLNPTEERALEDLRHLYDEHEYFAATIHFKDKSKPIFKGIMRVMAFVPEELHIEENIGTMKRVANSQNDEDISLTNRIKIEDIDTITIRSEYHINKYKNGIL